MQLSRGFELVFIACWLLMEITAEGQSSLSQSKCYNYSLQCLFLRKKSAFSVNHVLVIQANRDLLLFVLKRKIELYILLLQALLSSNFLKVIGFR